MAEEVKIAFIIVTYNSGDYLEQCICSIKKRCYLKSYKIVVVDNMSTDKTCEIANNHEGVQLIINPENLGFGTANNIASKSIKADYYFLFNADAYFEGTFDFTRMLEVFENDSKIAILSARLEYPDGSSQTSSFTFSTPSKWFVQCIPFYNL
jgi:GT2 family glycosyltransferase